MPNTTMQHYLSQAPVVSDDICPRHGINMLYYNTPSGQLLQCPQCEIESLAAAAQMRAMQDNWTRAILRAHVPARYRGETLTLETLLAKRVNSNKTHPVQLAAIRKLIQYTDRQDYANVVISGPCGTGKTEMCAAICYTMLTQRRKVRYHDFAEAALRIQSDWRTNSSAGEAWVDSELIAPDVLILDDIKGLRDPKSGIETITGGLHAVLEHVINMRYDLRRATILTGNFTSAQFCALLGERIATRISDGGLPIALTYEGYRQWQQQFDT
jgi:DNA replication protein DnaC